MVHAARVAGEDRTISPAESSAASGAAGIVLLALAFPTRIRTAGLSIGNAAGVTIFGGTAQVIFTWLMEATGDRTAPIWHVVAMSVVSIAATQALRIQRREPQQIAL